MYFNFKNLKFSTTNISGIIEYNKIFKNKLQNISAYIIYNFIF